MQSAVHARNLLVSWCVLVLVMGLVMFAGRRVREVSERQRRLLNPSVTPETVQPAARPGGGVRPLSPEERRQLRLQGRRPVATTAAESPALPPATTAVNPPLSGPTEATRPPANSSVPPAGSPATGPRSPAAASTVPLEAATSWGERCAMRMAALVGFSESAVFGDPELQVAGEWNSFWDRTRERQVAEAGIVSPVERFLGRMDLRRLQESVGDAPDDAAGGTNEPALVRPGVAAVVDVQEPRFARAIGQAGDQLYLHIAYEVRLLPERAVEDVFRHTGEIGLGLPLFAPAVGERVLLLECSEDFLFIITDRNLHRVHRKSGRSGRLPLPTELLPEGAYLFRYAWGGFHFITPEYLVRYNLRERKWQHYPLEYHFKPVGGIRVLAAAVERRNERLYYWISTARRGLVVVDDKGRNLRGPGGELQGIISSLPVPSGEIDLSRRPIRPLRRVADSLIFALNTPVDTTGEALLFRLDQRQGQFSAIPAPSDGIFEYNGILVDERHLVLLHDAGWQAIDRAKLLKNERVIRAGSALRNLVGGCLCGPVLYLIDYSANVYRQSLAAPGPPDREDGTNDTPEPGR